MWQLITGTALLSGLGGVLVQVLIPKRRDKLDRADMLTDNAMKVAERAAEDARLARERAEAAEKRLDEMASELRALKRENEKLVAHIRGFVAAWKKHMPGQPLPVDVEPYLV